VLVPLGHISDSLATSNPGPLEPLLAERSELGRVAALVRTSFDDRATLRRTLDERAQLSRDLHDGLIQTLYAIGMNLASIGPLLRQQPEQAEEAIDQSRTELNASIRELRGFIARLEPAATERDFAKAVRQLVDFMQTATPTARFDVAIDEPLANQLPVEHCTQLLYIVREALSNAVRHSRGSRIAVGLQPAGTAAILTVHDNGRGFDPAEPRVGGHGLDNMAERTLQLGGVLELKSQPGHGTLVTVRLPLPT
jgi:signal transduction histidine kinase